MWTCDSHFHSTQQPSSLDGHRLESLRVWVIKGSWVSHAKAEEEACAVCFVCVWTCKSIRNIMKLLGNWLPAYGSLPASSDIPLNAQKFNSNLIRKKKILMIFSLVRWRRLQARVVSAKTKSEKKWNKFVVDAELALFFSREFFNPKPSATFMVKF